MTKTIFSSLIAVLMLGLCNNKAHAQVQEDNKVYSFVSLESPPTYPGGMVAFYKFLGASIKYPQQAKDNNIQGNVFVSFTIEKDGSLNDIKVDRKLGGGTDEEAVRVLGLSKKWNPGLINGKPVKVKYNIPIKFRIPGKAMSPQPVIPGSAPTTITLTDTTVYRFVSLENPPTYPGGMASFYKFLGENIKYPKQAKDDNVQGNVFMSFVVEKDGVLSNIKVDRKLGSGTDEEAIRVLKSSQRWIPATVNGIPVRVKYNIPVRFQLPK